MKIKKLKVKEIDFELVHSLIKHFEYSIKDIESYDELTEEEKKIISKKLFNRITL